MQWLRVTWRQHLLQWNQSNRNESNEIDVLLKSVLVWLHRCHYLNTVQCVISSSFSSSVNVIQLCDNQSNHNRKLIYFFCSLCSIQADSKLLFSISASRLWVPEFMGRCWHNQKHTVRQKKTRNEWTFLYFVFVYDYFLRSTIVSLRFTERNIHHEVPSKPHLPYQMNY